MVTATTTLALFWPVGRISDALSAKVSFPLSAILVAIVLSHFRNITDPQSPLSYLLWCLTALVFMFQGISLHAHFTRNVPK